MNEGKADRTETDSLQRFFDRQLQTWPDARRRYRQLLDVSTRELACDTLTLKAQYNPARMVSTGASIDKKDIGSRPCFLCAANRPDEQTTAPAGQGHELLVNPFPILPMHFTIPSLHHEPQAIRGNYGEMLSLLERHPKLTVFYNGPLCGASAPDHAHFQAGTSGLLPLQTAWQRLCRSLTPVQTRPDGTGIWLIAEYPCAAFLLRSNNNDDGRQLFDMLYNALPLRDGEREPMMNIVCWHNGNEVLSVVFPRRKHRPDCYYASGGEQLLRRKLAVTCGARYLWDHLPVFLGEQFRRIIVTGTKPRFFPDSPLYYFMEGNELRWDIQGNTPEKWFPLGRVSL